MPSEALPACRSNVAEQESTDAQTAIWLDADALCIRIKRRKNRQQGSGVLRRKCSCQGDPKTCAIHVLWDKFLAELPLGTCPWACITPAVARDRLRHLLQKLGVPESATYGTHDFRRGHAEVRLVGSLGLHAAHAYSYVLQDLRRAGCSLAAILQAGQWKSAAFMQYLDTHELETVCSCVPCTCTVRSRAVLSLGYCLGSCN